MGDLDAPGLPDEAEDLLLVVPPASADPEVVVTAVGTGGGRGDSAVHQGQLEAVGDALPVQVRQHQFDGSILVS